MTDADLSFSASLYASTRAAEVAMFGWPEATQRAFLDQQHDAQHRHFRSAYPSAEWLIVEKGGEPIGRLYLDYREEAVHLVDIALLPKCQGEGTGSAILRDLAEYARAEGKSVSLRVEQNNPAARLYERLGFEETDSDGIYRSMVLRP
jgi:ribosomal protein S18 acetylase RimI-like enzyme